MPPYTALLKQPPSTTPSPAINRLAVVYPSSDPLNVNDEEFEEELNRDYEEDAQMQLGQENQPVAVDRADQKSRGRSHGKNAIQGFQAHHLALLRQTTNNASGSTSTSTSSSSSSLPKHNPKAGTNPAPKIKLATINSSNPFLTSADPVFFDHDSQSHSQRSNNDSVADENENSLDMGGYDETDPLPPFPTSATIRGGFGLSGGEGEDRGDEGGESSTGGSARKEEEEEDEEGDELGEEDSSMNGMEILRGNHIDDNNEAEDDEDPIRLHPSKISQSDHHQSHTNPCPIHQQPPADTSLDTAQAQYPTGSQEIPLARAQEQDQGQEQPGPSTRRSISPLPARSKSRGPATVSAKHVSQLRVLAQQVPEASRQDAVTDGEEDCEEGEEEGDGEYVEEIQDREERGEKRKRHDEREGAEEDEEEADGFSEVDVEEGNSDDDMEGDIAEDEDDHQQEANPIQPQTNRLRPIPSRSNFRSVDVTAHDFSCDESQQPPRRKKAKRFTDLFAPAPAPEPEPQPETENDEDGLTEEEEKALEKYRVELQVMEIATRMATAEAVDDETILPRPKHWEMDLLKAWVGGHPEMRQNLPFFDLLDAQPAKYSYPKQAPVQADISRQLDLSATNGKRAEDTLHLWLDRAKRQPTKRDLFAVHPSSDLFESQEVYLSREFSDQMIAKKDMRKFYRGNEVFDGSLLINGPSLRPGQAELLKWRIVDRLGEGTFSSVYKAIDLDVCEKDPVNGFESSSAGGWSITRGSRPLWSDDKTIHNKAQRLLRKDQVPFVAIKRIYVSSSPVRIANELEIMEDLRGARNVSELITAFRQKDQVYAVMPFHKNDDFRLFYKYLDPPNIRVYMRCLFRALKDTHRRGIIHRDVKPANFLFDYESGAGYLCDFGLAERYEPPSKILCQHSEASNRRPHGSLISTNATKEVEDAIYDARKRALSGVIGMPSHDRRPGMKANRAGTRGFRAPEVLLKCPDQTFAIDIWAAGIILFSIVCHKFPLFNSNDDMEALLELTHVFGKGPMEKCGMLHNRTILHNLPNQSQNPKLVDVIIKLNPKLYNPPSEYATAEEAKKHIEDVDQMLDLLKHLLKLDATKRATAHQALKHQFLQDGLSEEEKEEDERIWEIGKGACGDLHHLSADGIHTVELEDGRRLNLGWGQGLAHGINPCSYHDGSLRPLPGHDFCSDYTVSDEDDNNEIEGEDDEDDEMRID